MKDTSSTLGVGEMEITPVSKAIARHLGIDLTSEGKAARNRRGIALIVNGAPQSGKFIDKIIFLLLVLAILLLQSKFHCQNENKLQRLYVNSSKFDLILILTAINFLS